MKLRDWRQKQGISVEDLAAQVGAAASSVFQYENGRRRPRPEVARRIEAFTGGEVTAASLLGLDEPPKHKARSVREDGASFDYTDRPWRKPVSVSIDVTLTAGQLEDYRKHLPDLEAIAAEGALEAVREAYRKAWSEANREAIDAHTKWIEEHGTFHDQFGEW